jgi:hypothetical protein
VLLETVLEVVYGVFYASDAVEHVLVDVVLVFEGAVHLGVDLGDCVAGVAAQGVHSLGPVRVLVHLNS